MHNTMIYDQMAKAKAKQQVAIEVCKGISFACIGFGSQVFANNHTCVYCKSQTLPELDVDEMLAFYDSHHKLPSFIKVHNKSYERVGHYCRAYPGFCSTKRLGIFVLPLDGMLVHRR